MRATSRRAPWTESGAEAAVDSRLLAAVQARAGARCHEAAGLSQSYVSWAHCLHLAARRGDATALEHARRQVAEARAQLRRFLSALSPAQSMAAVA